jgi:DNA transformation protein and related proteins
MAAANDEFTSHCLELLAPLGTPRARRMFGGRGIYVDDLFLALIFAERLFLKTDVQTRAPFEAAGCTPFSFETKGETVSTSYFSAPDDAMESPGLMQPWARLALEAALRARAAKPASARAKTKATPPARAARPRKPPANT